MDEHFPLYLMPFDHRRSFERGFFDSSPPIPEPVRRCITQLKQVIFDANQLAVTQGAPRGQCGVLVDEEYGATIAREATAAGTPLAMPVERSGQEEFEFEYGDRFAEHIEAFDPLFTKVLVRWNPEGDVALNRRQGARLATLGAWLKEHGRQFLFELLVPATKDQQHECDKQGLDYDTDLRPQLAVQAIAQLQAIDVEPTIWKVEGFDNVRQADALVRQAQSGGREDVRCIVLGRGSDWAQVTRWLQTAGYVEGFCGFAVGRTLWSHAVGDYLAGRLTAEQATSAIAERYLSLIHLYEGASALGRAGGLERQPSVPTQASSRRHAQRLRL